MKPCEGGNDRKGVPALAFWAVYSGLLSVFGGWIMFKQIAVGVALLMWGAPALADWFGIGRVGALGGIYNSDFELVLRDTGGDVVDREGDSNTLASLGVFGGYTVAYDMFYADAALEFQTTPFDSAGEDGFDRTDLLLSVGVFLPRDFNASIGYRLAWQGDGFFDDDFYKESGPVIGIGFPSFPFIGNWRVNPSAAVNFTKLKFDSVDDEPSFTGVSLRAAVIQPDSPHSFGLRVQRFSGSDDESVEGVGRLDLDLTETYVHLFYQFSFMAMAW